MSEERRDSAIGDRRASTRGGRRRTDKLACPQCGCLQSSVLPSHPTMAQQQTGGFWRRRRCGGCGREFETEETVRAVHDAAPSCVAPPKPLAS